MRVLGLAAFCLWALCGRPSAETLKPATASPSSGNCGLPANLSAKEFEDRVHDIFRKVAGLAGLVDGKEPPLKYEPDAEGMISAGGDPDPDVTYARSFCQVMHTRD